MHLSELKALHVSQLLEMAQANDIEGANRLRKQELVFERHFAALARSLAALGIPVWLLGSKKDAAVGEEIVRLSEGAARNLCGVTNLAQAIHLIASARHVVTNDSGLMHVAAALGTPLTALFGSSSPGYTPPLSDKAQVISLGLSCSPCFKRECPLKHLDCLNGITPERVLATIQ